MADEREAHMPYQRNWYGEAMDCARALAVAREENGRLREALEELRMIAVSDADERAYLLDALAAARDREGRLRDEIRRLPWMIGKMLPMARMPGAILFKQYPEIATILRAALAPEDRNVEEARRG